MSDGASVGAPLRVAVLGCGKAGRAQIHWFGADPRTTVVSVWNRTKATADRVAAEIGSRSLRSWEGAAEDPGVDLVSLCGPSSTRAEQAVRVLGAGKPVLCEKPMARTLSECDAMVAASRASGAPLYCVFNMRFHPVVEGVSSALRSIGEIVSVDVAYTQHRSTVSWRHSMEQGGGVIKEQAVHVFDLLLLWMGRVSEVAAEMLVVHPGREAEDHGEVLLRFASGATGHVYASYCDPRPEFMTGALVGTSGRVEFVLSPYDPALNAVTISSNGEITRLDLRQATDGDPVYPGLADATQRLISFVIDRALDRQPTAIDGAAGRAAMEIVAAAYASDQRRAKIALPFEGAEAPASGWKPRHLGRSSPA
jgi:UDP-N-acetyl-2-amino-2-deoxyglucuronate dehydrogenase